MEIPEFIYLQHLEILQSATVDLMEQQTFHLLEKTKKPELKL